MVSELKIDPSYELWEIWKVPVSAPILALKANFVRIQKKTFVEILLKYRFSIGWSKFLLESFHQEKYSMTFNGLMRGHVGKFEGFYIFNALTKPYVFSEDFGEQNILHNFHLPRNKIKICQNWKKWESRGFLL